MLFEVSTSILAGGLVGFSYYKKSGGSDDAIKIQRICSTNGLTVKEDGKQKNMQLLRRSHIHKGKKIVGTEYAYRVPLGLSFKDFENKKDNLQDGLNNKRTVIDITLQDLRNLRLDKNIIQNFKQLLDKKKKLRKEIELSYDGLLKIRVYNEPLTKMFPYDDELIKTCHGWKVIVGDSRSGVIKHDFEKKAHIIVAGTTDFGKSNWVNTTINTLVHNKPDDVSFILIDLKGGLEFNRYRHMKQVIDYATNVKEAKDALQTAVDEMNRVTEYLLENGHSNVKDAGFKGRTFIVIDEAADMADDRECQDLLKDIARKGRAAGLRLIYTTQYPTTETVSSQVKRNCIGRLSFVLDTATASTVVLDQAGAEKLQPIQGRALYKDLGLIEVQTPYITGEKIKQNIQPHINIRPRKERVETNATRGKATTEGRKHSLIIEETELS